MNEQAESYFANLPEGPISPRDEVEQLLISGWHRLQGARDEGMQAKKLYRRTENMVWRPPYLTFTIERHGGTVNGSTRAELQDWRIHIPSWSAEIVSRRRRQLSAQAPRFNAREPAEKIANAIVQGKASPSLKRYPDGRVKVLIAKVVPDDGFKQTISGRRKRFRAALEKMLAPHGWTQTSLYTYQKAAT